MIFHRWKILLIVAGLWAGPIAMAAPTPAPVRAEIEALLASLSASSCEFSRNGSWHDAGEARSHLLRKLNHLEGKTTLQRTEDFIQLAGSTSSTSGKPYQVRCAGSAPMHSQRWMTQQLTRLRATAGAASAAP